MKALVGVKCKVKARSGLQPFTHRVMRVCSVVVIQNNVQVQIFLAPCGR